MQTCLAELQPRLKYVLKKRGKRFTIASHLLSMPSALLGPGCFAGQAFGSGHRCPLASSRSFVFGGQQRVHSAQHGGAEQSRRHAQLQARPLSAEKFYSC